MNESVWKANRRRQWQTTPEDAKKTFMTENTRVNAIVLEDETPTSDGTQNCYGEERRDGTSTFRTLYETIGPKPPGRSKADVVKPKKPALCLNKTGLVGTWNVRSMYEGKLEIVLAEMKRLNIELLGVSELGWIGKGHFQSGEYKVIFSGNDKERRKGNAIICGRKSARALLGYDVVNDRIITARFVCLPVNMTVIQVYAPTTDGDPQDTESFYAQLQDVIDKSPKGDIMIVMGDFNAKVGKGRKGQIVGDHGLGEENEAGENLIDFCTGNDLAVMNTWFQQPKRRLYTWTSPGGNHRNQIDYILINQRWKSFIQGVKTLPGADCGSDHELLVATLRIKLKKVKKPSTDMKYDLSGITPEYSVEVSNKFSLLVVLKDDKDTDDWKIVANIIKESAENHIPRRKKKKKSIWLSDKAIDIAKRRRKLKTEDADHADIQELNREFQKQARQDKETYLDGLCTEIEQDNRKGRTRDMFKRIKDITGQFNPRVKGIRGRQNNTLTEDKEIRGRWKQYAEELYKQDDRVKPAQLEDDYDWGDPPMLAHYSLDKPVQDRDTDIRKEVEEELPVLEKESTCTVLRNDVNKRVNASYDKEPPVLESEVRNALHNIANNKAPGADGIPAELIKACGEEGIRVLTLICNKALENEEWPDDWKKSVYVPIPKKGDPRVCDNNRIIALISHASKILLKIIQKRLENFAERELSETQAGFRTGRGTRDQIANIRWIMERQREFGQDVYLCFIDYTKAFDCVDHRKLWATLREMGLSEHLIRMIKSLYDNQAAVVRTESGDSDSFKVGKGVRQGCILSPILFNLYAEAVMREALQDDDEDEMNAGIRMGGRRIKDLRYADDTTLLADSKESLEELLAKVQSASNKAGLYLNVKKTKVMSSRDLSDFTVGTDNIEVVKNFNLLGSNIAMDGNCKAEIQRRLALGRTAMSAMNKIWKSRDISIKTKIRLVTVLVFPVVMYGCESWTINKEEERRIEAFEFWCWRRMLRVSWTEKRTNQSILETVENAHILRQSLLGQITRQKLTYFGHIVRSDGIGKALMTGMGDGTRRRGRPRTRWMDGVLHKMAMNLQEAKESALNRTLWKRMVMNVTRDRVRFDGTR